MWLLQKKHQKFGWAINQQPALLALKNSITELKAKRTFHPKEELKRRAKTIVIKYFFASIAE